MRSSDAAKQMRYVVAAIEAAGDQKTLSALMTAFRARLGLGLASQPNVSKWKRGITRLDMETAVQMQLAVDSAVRASDLFPYLADAVKAPKAKKRPAKPLRKKVTK